ncbi:MAG: hypothetical protein EBV10_01500 [Synechococcaceae bacterium WB6_1A_059]|nr:hypothetical protein [Synechococcaceae bacterium WB6_1A_059]
MQVVGGAGIGTTLHVGGQVRIYANNATNNTLTGALVVSGGVALGGDLRVGGNFLTVGAGTGGLITGLGGLTSTIITVTANTPATNTQTGALRVEGGVGIGGDLYARNIYQNGTLVGQGNVVNPSPVIFTITNTTAAISTTSGALQVAGGAGIGGDLYVGGAIVANRLTIQLTTITTTIVQTDDIIKTDNATAATSTNSGALQVAGGAGIGGAVYIGTTSFIFGSQILTTASVNSFVTPGITTGTTGTFVINNSTSATNTTTGALQVKGGVGIGQSIFVGGTITVGSASGGTITGLDGLTSTNIVVSGSTNATSTNTGALQVVGGAGVGRDLWVGGKITVGSASGGNISGAINISSELVQVTSTTNATSTSTGALQVRGGVGIGGAVYIGTTSFISGSQILTTATVNSFVTQGITTGTTGTFVINNTTNAVSTTTGAFQVKGGVGVGADVYIGGDIVLPRGSYNHTILRTGSTGEILKLGLPNINVTVDATSGVDIYTTDQTYFWNWSFNNDGSITFPNSTSLQTALNNENYWSGANANRFQQAIVINSSTQSTNTTSGALRVEGGLGVGGYISLGSGSGATGRIRWGTVHLAVRDAGDGFGSIFLNSGNASSYPTSTTSTSSVIIGALAAPNAGGDSNVVIGHLAGFNITSNRNSIFIGKNAGLSVNAGSSNVIIGGYTGNDSQLIMVSSNSNVILADGSGSIKAWADSVGQWIIPSTANAASSTTGALSIRGGVGIGKDLVVGGTVNVGGVIGGTITGLVGLTSTNIVVSGSANATSTNTGVLQVVGGAGFGRDLWVGGTIYSNGYALSTGSGGLISPYGGIFTMTNTTTSISSTTGALQVAGGVGVQKDMFVAGKITVGLTSGTGSITGVGTLKVESSLNPISTNTGALQVVGGAAINRDLYVGGRLLVAGGQATATNFFAFNLAMSVAFGY